MIKDVTKEEKMKNKFKYVLASCISLFLIISIINENMSSAAASLNISDKQRCIESKKKLNL